MNGCMQMFATAIVCLLVSLMAGEWKSFTISQVSAHSLAAMLYLATIGSIIAYNSYLYLLKMRPPAEVSTYVYVNPLIAVLLGAIIANERISFLQIVSLLVILCGVLLVNVPKYKAFRYMRR